MNAQEQRKIVALDTEGKERFVVLSQFKSEEIQNLGRDDLLAAKTLSGRGEKWGFWKTPESLAPRLKSTQLNIDFVKRLRDFLRVEKCSESSFDVLMDEGVMVLTRIALLMQLVSTGGQSGDSKSRRLKASTISEYMYTCWPKITAKALMRKADNSTAEGLLKCLTEEDFLELSENKKTRIEIERLYTLVARGVWTDAPPLPDIRQTTKPSSKPLLRPNQLEIEPHLPLPDEWLAEIGPRVLWVIEDMGPNLLRLLEALTEDLKVIDWSFSKGTTRKQILNCIKGHLESHPWLDRFGKPLVPKFRLTTAYGKKGASPFEWPPRNMEHVWTLSQLLQAAHLFITLLSSAGRVGEVSTLTRKCIEVGRDGKNYLGGFTYKLSGNLFGDARTWPAPAVLLQSLGQQVRLAAAFDWLPGKISDGLPEAPRFSGDLWVSIGVGGMAGEEATVNLNNALIRLAERLDMDPTPGGKNVHAHRFRKTIGRLAGVALFNSPLVLKRLFGHKSIEMTLHYILCDIDVRDEAEKVLRELRIMHCADALEEVHQALCDGRPIPGHGGPGAARLVTAVRTQEEQLNQSGRVWSEGSAFDLACLLTMKGQGWRLIKENIVCSKAPGEDGLCQKKRSKGQPNTANCQPHCDNRIVFARKRRDVELNIEQYLDIARQANADGQLLVLASVMENLQEEWASFPDIEHKYSTDPEVQAFLALCEEPECDEEII